MRPRFFTTEPTHDSDTTTRLAIRRRQCAAVLWGLSGRAAAVAGGERRCGRYRSTIRDWIQVRVARRRPRRLPRDDACSCGRVESTGGNVLVLAGAAERRPIS